MTEQKKYPIRPVPTPEPMTFPGHANDEVILLQSFQAVPFFLILVGDASIFFFFYFSDGPCSSERAPVFVCLCLGQLLLPDPYSARSRFS